MPADASRRVCQNKALPRRGGCLQEPSRLYFASPFKKRADCHSLRFDTFDVALLATMIWFKKVSNTDTRKGWSICSNSAPRWLSKILWRIAAPARSGTNEIDCGSCRLLLMDHSHNRHPGMYVNACSRGSASITSSTDSSSCFVWRNVPALSLICSNASSYGMSPSISNSMNTRYRYEYK